MNGSNLKPGDNFGSQVFFKPKRNFLGIPDAGVNVSFPHPRKSKPHYTGTCLLSVLKKVREIQD